MSQPETNRTPSKKYIAVYYGAQYKNEALTIQDPAEVFTERNGFDAEDIFCINLLELHQAIHLDGLSIFRVI